MDWIALSDAPLVYRFPEIWLPHRVLNSPVELTTPKRGLELFLLRSPSIVASFHGPYPEGVDRSLSGPQSDGPKAHSIGRWSDGPIFSAYEKYKRDRTIWRAEWGAI